MLIRYMPLILIATSLGCTKPVISFPSNNILNDDETTTTGGSGSTTGGAPVAVGPEVDLISLPANQTYTENQDLTFTLSSSDNIDVTGVPHLQIDIGGTIRTATYVSGSGTGNLIFRYTVQEGDVDADGIAIISPLDLNGGSLSASGEAVSLDLPTTNTSGIIVNSPITQSAPVFSSVSDQVFITGYEQEFFIPYEDPDFSDIHTFSVSGLGASGVLLNTTTGKFTIPAAATPGTYNVALTIDDGQGNQDTANFNLIIDAPSGTFVKDGSGATGTQMDNQTSDAGWWYVPNSYANNPNGKFCAIVFFHGLGENGDGTDSPTGIQKLDYGSSATSSSPVRLVNTYGRTYPCIYYVPQISASSWYDRTISKAFQTLFLRYPRIDRNRVYVTGLSIGGNASLVSYYKYGLGITASLGTSNHGAHTPTENQKITAAYPSLWHAHGWNDTNYSRITVTGNFMSDVFSYLLGALPIYDNYVFASASVIENGELSPDGVWTYTDDPTTLLYNRRYTIYRDEDHSNAVMLSTVSDDERLTWMVKRNKDTGIRQRLLKYSPEHLSELTETRVKLTGYFKDLDGAIDRVTANLSEVGGPSSIVMNAMGGGLYELPFIIPDTTTAGAKRIILTAYDQDGNHRPYVTTLNVSNTLLSSGDVYDRVRINFGVKNNDSSINTICQDSTNGWNTLYVGEDGNASNNDYLMDVVYGMIFDETFNLSSYGSDSKILMAPTYLPMPRSTLATGTSLYHKLHQTTSSTATGVFTAPISTNVATCALILKRFAGNLSYEKPSFKFFGLNPGFKYNIKTFSSYWSNGLTHSSKVSVQGNEQTVVAYQNVTPITFSNLILSEDLSLTVDLETNVNEAGFLNGIEIEMVVP